MKTLKKFLSVVLCVAMVCSVFTFAGVSVASAATTEKSSAIALDSAGAATDVEASSADGSTFSWDNASVYFLLTDRFLNGNTSNDHSYGRSLNQSGQVVTGNSDAGAFHGGDFAGITKKINEGYFDDLGVNALWISAPYEQMHGYCNAGAGKSGSFPHYSYHGYYALDFSQVDQNFGTEAEFETMVDTAHQHGIRIVLDVVMNHVGYNNYADMVEYGYGTLKSGWETAYYNATMTDVTYHQYIDYQSNSSDWAKWWGSSWLRAGLAGYTEGSGDLEGGVSYLPDLKENVSTTVDIPAVLKTKWTKEGTLSQKQNELNSYFSSTGKPKTVRYYLVHWLSQWVEKYGVDGFRCDTAKHVSLESWKALKDQCKTSLNTWRKNNSTKAGADWNDDFWMTGEVWGHGVNNDSYYSQGGFDSLINFSFNGSQAFDASVSGVPAAGSINNTYADYANSINTKDNFNVLSYLSSHDTALCRSNMIYQGSAFQLLPGAIQIFYGDESNRPLLGGLATGKDHNVRSDMNWSSLDQTTLKHWQKVGQFRSNHISVGAGSHKNLTATSGTAFARSYSKNGINDAVMAVIGATNNQNVTITVDSTNFPDGTNVTNAYDGSTATVSGGKVTFSSGANGTILVEKEGTTEKFAVTNTLGANITTSNNATEVNGGSSYSATLTAATGYSLGTVKVTMAGTDVTSSAYSNGKISISNVTGDIVITASAEAATYKVSASLVNATASNSATTVAYGSSYNNTITPNAGYKLASVTVMMDNKPVSGDFSSGVISISNVTGNIIISATATAIPTQGTTSTTAQDATTSTAPITVTKPVETSPGSVIIEPSKTTTGSIILGDANLDGKVNINDALLIQKYTLHIAVFSDQQMLAANVNGDKFVNINDALLIQKHTLHMSTGYNIGEVVGGDVTVPTVTETKPTTTNPSGNTFSVLFNPVNATISNNATTVTEGSNYMAIISPESGYEISMIEATVGGSPVALNKNSNGTYTINCTVTGDIIITCIALEKEDDPTTTTSNPIVTQPTDPTSETQATDPGPTPTPTPTPSGVVKLTDNAGWGSCNAYFFNTATGNINDVEWPGTPCTTEVNGYGETVFVAEIPEGAEYVIFNSGDDQTVNIPLTGEEGYYTNGTREANDDGKQCLVAIPWSQGGGDDPTPTPTPTPTPSGVVKFTDNAGWGSCNAYFFNTATGNIDNVEWPGTPCTTETNGYGETVFVAEIPESAEYVIFNNGDDQTVNIPLTGEEGYYTNGTREANDDGKQCLVAIPWSQGDVGGGGDIGGGGGGGTSGVVKFTDNAGWGSCNAYFFNTATGNINNVEWPGTACSTTTNGYGETVFVAEIPEGAEYVIFNNGDDQTVNIPLTGEEGYFTNGTREANDNGKQCLVAIPWSQG